jgi:hypothetical protein
VIDKPGGLFHRRHETGEFLPTQLPVRLRRRVMIREGPIRNREI